MVTWIKNSNYQVGVKKPSYSHKEEYMDKINQQFSITQPCKVTRIYKYISMTSSYLNMILG